MDFSSAARLVFLLTVAGVACLFVGAAWRAYGHTLPTAISVAGLGSWLLITYWIAAGGYLSDFEGRPPAFLLFFAVSVGVTFAVALSSFGSRIVEAVSWEWLIGFQVFRIPVEWFLHRGYLDGVVPVQMTYDGLNFDVASGISALLLALWIALVRPPPKSVVFAWCFVGMGLLFTIVSVAILSAPTPMRVFDNEPANTFVVTAPYVWLPAFLVQAALFGHLLVLRKLHASN